MNMYMSDSPSYKIFDGKDFLFYHHCYRIYLLYIESNAQFKTRTNNP